jgi:hypothetical protein
MQGAKVPTRSQRYQTPYAFLLVSYMPLASKLCSVWQKRAILVYYCCF